MAGRTAERARHSWPPCQMDLGHPFQYPYDSTGSTCLTAPAVIALCPTAAERGLERLGKQGLALRWREVPLWGEGDREEESAHAAEPSSSQHWNPPLPKDIGPRLECHH